MPALVWVICCKEFLGTPSEGSAIACDPQGVSGDQVSVLGPLLGCWQRAVLRLLE